MLFALRLAVLIGALLLSPRVADAQQGLRVFILSANYRSTANVEARLSEVAAEAELHDSRLSLGPTLTAAARYTFNEPTAELEMGGENIVISPVHQLDGSVGLRIPLVDSQSWAQIAGADANLNASRAARDESRAQVAEEVSRLWFSLVGQRAIRRAAFGSLEVAREDLRFSEVRAEAGLVSELDVVRSRAEVARTEGTLATARLNERLIQRDLEALARCGVEDVLVQLDVEPLEERVLAYWLRDVDRLASVRQAEFALDATEDKQTTERRRLLPRLDGVAEIRATNAAGFGQPVSARLGVELNWQVDLGMIANARRSSPEVELARARLEDARQNAATGIIDAYERTLAYRVLARTASAVEAQFTLALDVARARYRAGTGQQLDVLQALHDLQNAVVGRIRARADLGFAQYTLRLRSGRVLP
ncbi:MAG: TolC family protein [Polyangiales bacterium]